MPDIDTTHSTLGRLLKPISKFLDENFGHRTITHSLLGFAILAGLFYSLYFIAPAWYKAGLIGYLSHLLIDTTNKTGVPFLYPNNTYAVFPGNSRWRIKVGSLGEYILCGIFILLTVGIWYLQGIGLRSWFNNMIATPQMAASEYRSFAGQYSMQAKVEGFYTLSQKPIENANFELIDSLDDSTLLGRNADGKLITIGKSHTSTIQAKKIKVFKVKPIQLSFREVDFNKERLDKLLPLLDQNSFVSGTVTAFEKEQYIKMNLKPFLNGEFESIKITAAASPYDSTLELKNATIDRFQTLHKLKVSGVLIMRNRKSY